MLKKIFNKIYYTSSRDYDAKDPYAQGGPTLNPEPPQNTLAGFVGSLIAISLLTYLTYNTRTEDNLLFITGSCGASAVLFFALPNSAVAQPRNVVLGNLIGSVVGITCRNIFTSPDLFWISAGLAVSVTIALTTVLKCVYPPSGATALIASTLPFLPRWSGYLFVLMPVMTASVTMLLIALIVNNAVRTRHYPDRWH